MREKQILPVAVIGLTAMLVAVVALWTLDRAEGTSAPAVSGSGPVDVIEWLVTTWPKDCRAWVPRQKILRVE